MIGTALATTLFGLVAAAVPECAAGRPAALTTGAGEPRDLDGSCGVGMRRAGRLPVLAGLRYGYHSRSRPRRTWTRSAVTLFATT